MASVNQQAVAFARSVAPSLTAGATEKEKLAAILGGLKKLGVPKSLRQEVATVAQKAVENVSGGAGAGAADVKLKKKPHRPPLVIPSWVMHAVNFACLTGAGTIAATTAGDMSTRLFADKHKSALQNAMLSNGILAIAALVWFPVFDLTIGTHRVFAEPKVIVGYIWPILMSVLDMVHISRRKSPDASETKDRDKYLTSQVGAVIAAAFSLALLLSNTRSPSVTKLILVALAIALLSVLPSPQLKEGSLAKSGVQVAQKSILMYTISIVAVGLLMDLSQGSLRSEPSLPGGSGMPEETAREDLHGGSMVPGYGEIDDPTLRFGLQSIGRKRR